MLTIFAALGVLALAALGAGLVGAAVGTLVDLLLSYGLRGRVHPARDGYYEPPRPRVGRWARVRWHGRRPATLAAAVRCRRQQRLSPWAAGRVGVSPSGAPLP